MRLIALLSLAFFLGASPASAQTDLSVYNVTDVAVDMTAATATQARDLAMIEAQRKAFTLLMERLGATVTPANVSNELIATLTQALDIQKEHAANGSYKGTFSVQFKPDAVRNYLSGHNVNFVETRAEPVLVLPVLEEGERKLLWDEITPWQDAWQEAKSSAALVPVVLAQGGMEDIATISAQEAVTGRAESLTAMMRRYGAQTALVALLRAELPLKDEKEIKPTATIYRYDDQGALLLKTDLTLPPIKKEADIKNILVSCAKDAIGQMEKQWRETNKSPSGTPVFLPVQVPVPTLAAWTKIHNKMKMALPIVDAHIITMTRGLVHAEIEFRGTLSDLQNALTEQGLFLEQSPSGGWILRDQDSY